jgi:hypothetical protein
LGRMSARAGRRSASSRSRKVAAIRDLGASVLGTRKPSRSWRTISSRSCLKWMVSAGAGPLARRLSGERRRR